MCLSQLYQVLRELHCTILCSEQHCIIFGDLNVNWLNKDQASGLSNLMISQYGYSQHVKDYTTVYETIIDHIYTNISVY